MLADAVVRLFPEAKPTIGPVIENGFYYDFDYPPGFSDEDLIRIESEMMQIIKSNENFKKIELSRGEALEFFKKRGDKYKVEILEGIPAGENISLYEHGRFVDLCKGPHVEQTGQIKAIKLLSVAGAYWRGDERNAMLQRIYGTAFGSNEDLEAHLARIEEAKKRDHRKLGKDLGLFTFHKESPASPFFHPKGTTLYNVLIAYVRGLYAKEGYDEVITPQVFDSVLWHRSGHYENYKENMYFTSVEEREFAVKPMNCPGHCLMFGEKKWSYRELPVRYADFGRLHRFERSGVVHGLTRVRTFCQDDAHIFCRSDQMKAEIKSFLNLVKKVYDDFNFTDVKLKLATRPEKYIGTPELWDKAEKTLAEAMTEEALAFDVNPGEGAFYGPKIEFHVSDAIGRPYQLGTLQVDYSMPERFDLEYIDEAQAYQRPVMLHRAILGSLERFIGIYVEHCAGAFPFWLAPVQGRILTLSETLIPQAEELLQKLKLAGYRFELDVRNEKLGLKIRDAQLHKVPYMLVMGKKEIAENKISVRTRVEGDLGAIEIPHLFEKLAAEKTPHY